MSDGNSLIISTSRTKGRITKAQKNALLDHQGLLINLDSGKDLNSCFDKNAPIICEIGFGNGDCLCEVAKLHPQYNFLGIDVYMPGVGSALVKIKELNLKNVRLVQADAREVWDYIRPNSLMRIHVLFSDPWPKKRNYKRRLIQELQINSWLNKLVLNGKLWLATDEPSYQEYIDYQLSLLTNVNIINDNVAFMESCEKRPITKYEKRGLSLGNVVRDWCVEKI